MKGLVLQEPWLQLILDEKKTVEFRTWEPRVVRPPFDLLLCSSATWSTYAAGNPWWDEYDEDAVEICLRARGHARVIVRVREIHPADEDRHGLEPGFALRTRKGRRVKAWELDRVRPLQILHPVKGRLGLLEVPGLLCPTCQGWDPAPCATCRGRAIVGGVR